MAGNISVSHIGQTGDYIHSQRPVIKAQICQNHKHRDKNDAENSYLVCGGIHKKASQLYTCSP
jgi:hypothetical protein